MYLRVRVPIVADAIRRSIVRAQKAVPNVDARLGQQLASMDRTIDTDQHGELDRASGMEPTITIEVELRVRLEVGDGDGERARAGERLELAESRAQLIRRAQRRDWGPTGKTHLHGEQCSRNAWTAPYGWGRLASEFSACRLGSARHREDHGRPTAILTRGPQVAAHATSQVAADREPESRALGRRRE